MTQTIPLRARLGVLTHSHSSETKPSQIGTYDCDRVVVGRRSEHPLVVNRWLTVKDRLQADRLSNVYHGIILLTETNLSREVNWPSRTVSIKQYIECERVNSQVQTDRFSKPECSVSWCEV